MVVVTVAPWERTLHYRRGQLVEVLAPGRHRLRGFGHELADVDMRARLLSLATQEVPTADGLRVKVGASLTWSVVEPVAWNEVAEDPHAIVYEAGRRAVRDVVGNVDLATAMTGFAAVEVPAELAAATSSIGVEVTGLRVTDVVPPAEVRRALESVVVARHRSEAQLEEARGQSAAVRNLANVAALLDDHPALAALRLAEVASAAGGSVIIERPVSS